MALKRWIFAFVIAGHAASLERAVAFEAAESDPPVGIARMLPNGTIILDLFVNDHVATAEGRFTYHPGDHAYKDLIQHLQGLKPGERKAVPPWSPGEGGQR